MIDARDPAATGTAQILTGDLVAAEDAEIHRKYLSAAASADAKVGSGFAAFDDVTIAITPEWVIAWDMREINRQFLGGAIRANPANRLPLEPGSVPTVVPDARMRSGRQTSEFGPRTSRICTVELKSFRA
jgi:hypothetical protein